MSSDFNEKTRVQMPALVHLTKLGYNYFGKISEEAAGTVYDQETNILIDVFHRNFARLNPEYENEWENILKDIKNDLKNNDDLGKAFYKRLTTISPIRLIDYDNPENNEFTCTGEFTCRNGEDNFRPDITLFVNGLPLCFVEVKKKNNAGGVVAEAKRMTNDRFPNKKYKCFINITQLMIFSNNMEYSALGGIVPVEGAFYCTGAKKRAFFNCFREENKNENNIAPYNEFYPYLDVDPAEENRILKDFYCEELKEKPEYKTNLDINTPTNRILTSMCSPERLLYIIRYGIAYVDSEKEVDGVIETINEKHIMRYQQMFASMAITKALDNGTKSGVIWHTQGSGKTALSFYLTKILTDYYAKKNTVTKFYFVVDRIDLLKQARDEFKARGLVVQTANSKKELMEQFRNNQSQEGSSGKAEISVINIQKVEADHSNVAVKDFATNLQRIFIIDEAHRGYKPDGCFLSNLFNADKDSIKIALTGTPILKEERSSCAVFGNYFHAYYYDKSIKDGYTLKIIREEIETSYKTKLTEIHNHLSKLVQKKELSKDDIISHENYVKELLRYIITDLSNFRMLQGDPTLGGMIICESSEQARKLYEFFDVIQDELIGDGKITNKLVSGLILYDSDDKETKEQTINNFKKNFTVDILIVFNMLLTGFDAPRLKRLYFGRKLKDHGLLQAITRVNRPYTSEYGTQRYGTVIDFADIKQNFEEINSKYIREFNKFSSEDETGIENIPDMFNSVLESKEELVKQMKIARQALVRYDTNNAEKFENQINEIGDKKVLIDLRTALQNAKNTFNLVRTFGDDDIKETFSHLAIEKLPELLSSVQARITEINLENDFISEDDTKMAINETLFNIKFSFAKIGQEELELIDHGNELQKKLQDTIREFTNCIDPEDPKYITLQEAFRQRFKQHHFKPENMEQYKQDNQGIDDILKGLTDLKKFNNSILDKYRGDKKFVRVHKRILEENKKRESEHKNVLISEFEEDIFPVMNKVKDVLDTQIYNQATIVKNEAAFNKNVFSAINDGYNTYHVNMNFTDYTFLQKNVSLQYFKQYNMHYF